MYVFKFGVKAAFLKKLTFNSYLESDNFDKILLNSHLQGYNTSVNYQFSFFFHNKTFAHKHRKVCNNHQVYYKLLQPGRLKN